MANILVENNFYISTSSACIVDLTPPTFSGITFLDVESRGQIRAGWAAATDPTLPIRYEVYIKAGSSVGLFNTTNIVALTPNLNYDIFTMPDGSFLVNGTVYYVGVRAIDGVNNRDSNVVSMNVVSTGVLTSIDVYENKMSWSVDDNNQFRITLWNNKNESLTTPSSAVLGTASYQVFTKSGTPIVGMSESGIAANSEGLFIASAVSNLLSEESEHYEVKVSIQVDGETRVNFIEIPMGYETFTVDGSFSVNDNNQIIGSLWCKENEKILTSGLGSASFQIYKVDGTIVAGATQSGLSADGNGFFAITPFTVPGSMNLRQNHVVKVSVTINGILRSSNFVVQGKQTDYSCKSIFSINASNQLEATFWATINEELANASLLGTASYAIYDKNGTAVAGLTQSGIMADVNGKFHITPVSALLLTDLTHYTAIISITVAGVVRTSAKGFTLLGA